MHNLHLIRVLACSGEEAINIADSILTGWGTENNWYSYGGAISKSGKIYLYDNDWARWAPTKDTKDTDLLETIKILIPKPLDYKKFRELVDKEDKTWFDWFSITRMSQDETERIKTIGMGDNTEVSLENMWDIECYAYNFDDCGITEIFTTDKSNPVLGSELWYVYLDMHS